MLALGAEPSLAWQSRCVRLASAPGRLGLFLESVRRQKTLAHIQAAYAEVERELRSSEWRARSASVKHVCSAKYASCVLKLTRSARRNG